MAASPWGCLTLEIVEFAPEWTVELSTPFCGLNFDCGSQPATHGIRVHNCMFAYSCTECVREYVGRVRATYEGYDVLKCSKCKQFYSRKKYASIIKLNKSERL